MRLVRWHYSDRPARGEGGTMADGSDMDRMNKWQELNRIYTTITLVGYAAIVGLTWPFALISAAISLTNGGPAGAIWVFLATCAGMFTVVLSMAEMAAIEPTAGGQYHWVSIFAPPKLRKHASYFVGWMCALGWQSFVPGAANAGGAVLSGLGVVASSSYVPKAYHIVLISIFITTFAMLFNIFLARKLPGIEGAVFWAYILGFIAFFIILLTMGSRSSASEVLTHFEDNADWGSIGTACFVGISAPVITIIGADSAVHLAEELKDASRRLPRAMMASAGINYLLGFLMLAACVAVVGDINEVLASSTGQPWIQVVWNATQSRVATVILIAIVVFFCVFAAVNCNTTSSRQIYAFARDGGLPYSRWISYVSPNRNIPINAVLLTWFIGSCLSIIPLGSAVAFGNIQMIGNSGLLVSYIICIASRLHHRNSVGVYGHLGKRPSFCLGLIGGNITNTLAICFLICFLVAGMFPSGPNPTVETMNWACVALGGTITVAAFAYVFLHKTYLGAGMRTASDYHQHQDRHDESPDITGVQMEIGKGYENDKGLHTD